MSALSTKAKNIPLVIAVAGVDVAAAVPSLLFELEVAVKLPRSLVLLLKLSFTFNLLFLFDFGIFSIVGLFKLGELAEAVIGTRVLIDW